MKLDNEERIKKLLEKEDDEKISKLMKIIEGLKELKDLQDNPTEKKLNDLKELLNILSWALPFLMHKTEILNFEFSKEDIDNLPSNRLKIDVKNNKFSISIFE